MKANKFFLGLALIGAILTGCENKEPETNGDEAKAYMSVKISMASPSGSRAIADCGFAVGTKEEQQIFTDESIFLFYDAAGNWVTSGELKTQVDLGSENKVPDEDHGDLVNDSQKEAYIVLSGPDDELKKSTQVLTVVNYSNCEGLKFLNLTEALKVVATTANDPAYVNDPTTEGLLMSTAVYVDVIEGVKTIVNTTKINGATDICQTPAAAAAHPVEIYIERASAKAELLKNSESDPDFGKLTVADNKGIVLDGVLTDVTVDIIGWTLNNVHESTYLVKELDEDWKTTDPITGWTAWNWAANHRSYWAKGHNWGATDNTGNTVYKYKDAKLNPNGETPMYCYENTVNLPKCAKGEPSPNVNTVLIAAQFKVGSEAYQNLYEYYGVFYRENTYKELILKQINDLKITRSGGTALTINDILFVKDGTTLEGIKFNLKDEVTYAKNGVDKTKTEIEDEINNLSYIDEARGYALGQCYYQIPVEHLGGTTEKPNYGMVRNHWYEIGISAINHVGEPVYDPEIPIPGIPEESKEYYLAARIHVLSWHVVKQSVEL